MNNPSSLRAQKGAEEEKFTHSFTTTEISERLQVIKPLILKQAQTHSLPFLSNKQTEKAKRIRIESLSPYVSCWSILTKEKPSFFSASSAQWPRFHEVCPTCIISYYYLYSRHTKCKCKRRTLQREREGRHTHTPVT